MTKVETGRPEHSLSLRVSSFVILSDFGIRYSSFPRGSIAQISGGGGGGLAAGR
jgi:hypothetical protein